MQDYLGAIPPRGGNSKCKDPGAERPSMCWRSRKEASMTAAGQLQRQAGGKGQRGQQGLAAQGPRAPGRVEAFMLSRVEAGAGF